MNSADDKNGELTDQLRFAAKGRVDIPDWIRPLLSKAADTIDLLETIERHAADMQTRLAIIDSSALPPTGTPWETPPLDDRNFYELCQKYRHARVDAAAEFNAIIEYLTTGKLPWPSYVDPAPRIRRADEGRKGSK